MYYRTVSLESNAVSPYNIQKYEILDNNQEKATFNLNDTHLYCYFNRQCLTLHQK